MQMLKLLLTHTTGGEHFGQDYLDLDHNVKILHYK